MKTLKLVYASRPMWEVNHPEAGVIYFIVVSIDGAWTQYGSVHTSEEVEGTVSEVTERLLSLLDPVVVETWPRSLKDERAMWEDTYSRSRNIG